MSAWMRKAFVLVLLAASGCGHRPAVPASSRDELPIRADVPSSAVRPAEMQLVLKKGALRLSPATSADAPSLEGIARAPDATLLPHVVANARGIAVVQDFTPDETSPKIAWDLRLGSTPLRFFAHVVSSEEQHVDLGGRSLVTARLYNEGGHLDLDWSAPSALASDRLELWSIGYLEVRHLGRSRAKHVELKNVGNAEIDFGDGVDGDLALDVVASTGNLALVVPPGTAARATLDAPPTVRVDAEGWARDPDGAYVTPGSAAKARVTIVVHAPSGHVGLRVGSPRSG